MESHGILFCKECKNCLRPKNKITKSGKSKLTYYCSKCNYYYDFNFNESFVPFLGVGAGYADFSNGESKEFSRSLYGGAKYYFNEIIYVGAKLSYKRSTDPKIRTASSTKTLTRPLAQY